MVHEEGGGRNETPKKSTVNTLWQRCGDRVEGGGRITSELILIGVFFPMEWSRLVILGRENRVYGY